MNSNDVLGAENYPRRVLAWSRWLVALSVSSIGVLALVPWQQTAPGAGQVVAYSPVDRQQVVEAPLKGRVVKWHVVEGQEVSEGDVIAEIQDIDPNYLKRLKQNKDALTAQLEAAGQQVSAYRNQVEAVKEARSRAIQAAEMKVKMALQKVVAAHQKVKAAEAAHLTAKLYLKQTETLYKKGLKARRDMELATLSEAKALTALQSARAALSEVKALRLGMEAERAEKGATMSAKVSSSQASEQKASASMNYTKVELAKIDTAIARQESQIVRAPRGGNVLHLRGHAGGEIVKAGDELATIVPNTDSRAVEVWIDGRDTPLVEKGNQVRLQFEGWPAVQFSGWPSAAVGTFGGVVALVDATSRRNGQFRILVTPDPTQPPWPEGNYLLQGVLAKGWVMLNQVSLGYELWRQLNGFPVSVPEKSKALAMDSSKKKGS